MKTRRRVLPLVVALVCLAGSGRAAGTENSSEALIDVQVTGTGARAVLFIPGLATPGTIWDDTVGQLKGDYTCHVISLAGFGGKPPARREHLLAAVRDEIIAYVRGQKLDRPVIVGHSLGGVIALDVAANAPDLPGGLVIVDSLPFLAGMMEPGIETEADARKLATAIGQGIAAADAEQFARGQKQFMAAMVTSPQKAAAIAAVTGKSDPATVGQALSELVGHDLRPELKAIKCPVLILSALADKVETSSREQIEKDIRGQYANLPQARFQFFDHARHFIMIDDPAGFQAALLGALAPAQPQAPLPAETPAAP